jgi:Gram-negative bacterial tonB protein.
MASATTTDFVATATKSAAPPFSLIEQKSLLARLAEELARTSREFARDPRGFLRDLFADDTKDARRRRLIYFGLAGALVIHAVLLTVIAVIGWHSLTTPKETLQVITLPSLTSESAKVEEPKANIPRGDKNSGGGEAHSQPATKGQLPPSSSQPPLVKPIAPSKPLPSLPVQATIVGPDSPPPTTNQLPGIPNGATDAPPAPGVGKVDGIGGRDGSGAGSNDGSGGGRNKGAGNNPNGSSNGTPNGTGTPADILYNAAKPPGYVPFSWIRRATAIVTPEAQEHKAAGRVLLKATFNADGTISDVETINPVEFMTESAIESLRRSKFRPASINGVPITVRRVPVYIDVHY